MSIETYIQPIKFSEEKEDFFCALIGKQENKIGNTYLHEVKSILPIHMFHYGEGMSEKAPTRKRHTPIILN